jgi:predicted RNase H-like nuclease (RuvC/YqgF family)
MKDQIEFLTQRVEALQKEVKRLKKINKKLINKTEVLDFQII